MITLFTAKGEVALQSFEDLPAFSELYEGRLVYINSEDMFYFGAESGWKSLVTSDSYVPTTLADWNSSAPTSITNALDRIASEIGPIT